MALPSLKDYSFLEKIGTGSYATVYKAYKKVCKFHRINFNIYNRAGTILFQYNFVYRMIIKNYLQLSVWKVQHYQNQQSIIS